MSYRIQKAAVLGSGVMGTGIACHLANVGLEVVMLDIVPRDLSEADQQNPVARNAVAAGALKAALKNKPAALYRKQFASRITVGNFDDDFDKIADADWIIEVVVERLDIKHKIFAQVEQHRKKGSLVTSNTSSIPIRMLVEGRSDEFKEHFCGTHFFNPPRYMRLLEVIPHEGSKQDVIDFFMHFGDVVLGKQTVLCKDTPAFIANRIGVMSGIKMFELTDKHKMSIEEVDAITGPFIGRPKTATFKLQDLVGLDTGDKVSRFVLDAAKDEFLSEVKTVTPPYMEFLLENKFLGRKSGKGFYERTKEKDENGKRIINALNLQTLEYAPATKPRLELVGKARNIERFDKRMQVIMQHESREGDFIREYFAALLSYAAMRVPEISDEIYSVDDAMRSGYAWDYGPFEYWDAIGLQEGIDLIKAHHGAIPAWIEKMSAQGAASFYKKEGGKKLFYQMSDGSYAEVPSAQGLIILDTLRGTDPVFSNSECNILDIGDGVLCVEFTSKSNAIGQGIGEGILHAIELAESEGWQGVVIGNNATNFTVGANLMNIGMLAAQQEFDLLSTMVDGFQQINMRIRTSKIPVVVATQGYVFGGGCEISMHADAGIYAAESYIGLVEVGVGLLPGGGGTKEMALRASDKFFEGDVQMPTLIDHFKPIAMAAVATSADEAFEHNYLLVGKDEVCMNTPRNISEAKRKVIELARNYVAPTPRTDVEVLGRAGLATLYTAINEFLLGQYMSEYDAEIARKVAYVICGGDLTSSQSVSEQYLLDIEREGFLSLLGNQKTLDRIQYMLVNNKPLRN
ncbi:MAG: 3-hydroxyacyl-CoA dehydrogenase/enoyl-CoA hydratase family protein [Saprospiraceae bacterium]|nr:3-hydroxyacyl-CoA dehydrogenase/enoyl-CoA hydratase family protein [Saprospiraceae bacterium]